MLLYNLEFLTYLFKSYLFTILFSRSIFIHLNLNSNCSSSSVFLTKVLELNYTQAIIMRTCVMYKCILSEMRDVHVFGILFVTKTQIVTKRVPLLHFSCFHLTKDFTISFIVNLHFLLNKIEVLVSCLSHWKILIVKT